MNFGLPTVYLGGSILLAQQQINDSLQMLLQTTMAQVGSLMSSTGGSLIKLNTSAFNNILASTDDTVQKALDRIDNLELRLSSNSNLAIGVAALNTGPSGNNNVAIGQEALKALTSGSVNVAIGRNAGIGLTEGSGNICIGYQSNAQATAYYQIAIGSSAICTGEAAVAIGKGTTAAAGQLAIAATTTANTVKIGNAATTSTVIHGYVPRDQPTDTTNFSGLLSATEDTIQKALDKLDDLPLKLNTTTSNYTIGAGTLSAVTTGTSNICIGFEAGKAITTGLSNTMFGYQAGYTTTTGAGNIALGESTQCSPAAHNQIAIGRGAVCQGEAAVAIGKGITATAGQLVAAATTTVNTVQIGNAATTSTVIYGYHARNQPTDTTNFGGLLSATEDTIQKALDKLDDLPVMFDAATSNYTIGAGTLSALTTGTSNICIGYEAGKAITTGLSNTMFGYQAGYTTTTGTGNIAIGEMTQCGPAAHNQIAIGRGAVCQGEAAVAIGKGVTAAAGQLVAAATTTANTVQIGNAATTSTVIHGYVPRDQPTDTTNFGGLLSATEDTIQKALDKLDDHTHAAPAGDFTVGGYLQIGDTGTGIKQKYFTITLHGDTGGITNTAHGLTFSKIRSHRIIVKDSTYSFYYLPNDTESPGAHYYAVISSTNIAIYTALNQDASILGSTAYVTLDYVA